MNGFNVIIGVMSVWSGACNNRPMGLPFSDDIDKDNDMILDTVGTSASIE